MGQDLDMSTVGEALRDARTAAGKSQMDLSYDLRIPHASISRRENGHQDPGATAIEEVVRATRQALVVTPDEGWSLYTPPTVTMRSYGRVPCGHAIRLADDDEAAEVDLEVLSGGAWDPDRCYLLQAAGESMRDAGILDGDWLVVRYPRPAELPRPGSIVVMSLNEETTVKRLSVDAKRDVWMLVPAHPDYTPRDITEWDEVAWRGTVVGQFRYTALG